MDKKELIKRVDALEKRLNKLRDEINKPIDLFKKIKTYSDVCVELGVEESDCPYQKIKHIEKLFNGDWKKDWSNVSQKKWYPYFEYKYSGFGFGSCRYAYVFGGGVGFYKDEETAQFVGKTFVNIYQEIAYY